MGGTRRRRATPQPWVRSLGELPRAGRPICRARVGLNVNGQRVPQKGYITDELTDYALRLARAARSATAPVLSVSVAQGRARRSSFRPTRHKGRYANERFDRPATLEPGGRGKAELRPMWVQNQRNSWHGVDFPYHGDARHRRVLQALLRNAPGSRREHRPRAGARCSGADCSNRRWSCTWATTASRSASTG